jgi:RHS repeat-associated protein
MWNRISKAVTANGSVNSTWYVRDAQGNVLSVYEKKASASLTQTEVDLYGSSRLGVYNRTINVEAAVPSTPPNPFSTTFERGDKFFELANHLGNVLVTVSDKKLVHATSGVFDYYEADVTTATDYYPFGMQMPGRNGKAVTGGGWASGSTLVNGVSVPTDMVVDNRVDNTPPEYKAANSVTLEDGFESGINDEFEALIGTAANTGVGTPEGSGGVVSDVSSYRYGFNGQEHDVDNGNGDDDYTAEYWEYDSRIGRRWNLDPKPTVGVSMYSAFGGNPIWHSDPLGDTDAVYNSKGEYINTINSTGRLKIFVAKSSNDKLVETLKGKNFSKLPQNRADELTKRMEKLGLTYDIQSVKTFYKKHFNTVRAKWVNGEKAKDIYNFEVNNKPATPYSELEFNTIIGANNIITVSDGSATASNLSMRMCYPSSLKDEPNKVGDGHLHPLSPGESFSYSKSKNSLNSAPVFKVSYPENISEDLAHATETYKNMEVRTIVVDAKYIYLLNGNIDQTKNIDETIRIPYK